MADNQVCFVLAGIDDPAKVAAFYEHIPSSAMLPKMIAAMQLGRSSEALAILEPARIAYWSINVLIWSETLDPIRDTPAFKVFLQKSNLAEPHQRAQAWRAAHPPEKR